MSIINLKNQTYDRLRFTVEVLLPSLVALISATALIWGLPYTEQIVATLGAVTVFLSTILKRSRRNYSPPLPELPADGALVVNETDPNKDTFTLKVDVPFSELKHKSSITLLVENQGSQ